MALKLQTRSAPRRVGLDEVWPVVNANIIDENGVEVTASAPDLNLMAGLGASGFVAANSFLRCASASYDVTGGDSGAIGTRGLGVAIPANSLIIGSAIDVSETFTDGDADGATIALSVASAGDILAAAAIDTDVWDQGLHAGIPVFTIASAIKTTVEASIVVTVAVAPLTAGAMTVHVFYIPTVADAA